MCVFKYIQANNFFFLYLILSIAENFNLLKLIMGKRNYVWIFYFSFQGYNEMKTIV